MRLSLKTMCPNFGKAIIRLFSSGQEGEIAGIYDEAVWLKVDNRLIMLASEPRLMSPFTILIPERILNILQLELDPQSACYLSLENKRLTFERSTQIIQLLTHWHSSQEKERSKVSLKKMTYEQFRCGCLTLLNYLNDKLKECEIQKIWSLSFLNYSPSTLSELIASLVLTFTTTSEDPAAELNHKWRRLNQLENYLVDLLNEASLPIPSLDSFMEQWEFKGALLPGFLRQLLGSQTNLCVSSPDLVFQLTSAELFLIGYLAGMYACSHEDEPMSSRRDYMTLISYIWGKGNEETSPLFKEICYYLSLGESWSSIEHLIEYSQQDSYIRLILCMDQLLSPSSLFGLELILGFVCRLIYENFQRVNKPSPMRKSQQEKLPI